MEVSTTCVPEGSYHALSLGTLLWAKDPIARILGILEKGYGMSPLVPSIF